MFKKVILLIALLGITFLANAQTQTNVSLRQQRQFIPERIVYRTLFYTIALLNQKANEAASQGRTDTAQNYRRALRQDFELSNESTSILDRIAGEYEIAVREIDAQAQAILRQRRRYYPDNKLPAGRQPLAPSPELAALQQQRDLLAVQYATRLREALGENEWRRFDELVVVRVASGIKPNNAVAAEPTAKFIKTSATGKAQITAQSVITGSTLISYDAYSNTITSVSTTELDYNAQDFYSGWVSGNIRDSSDSVLASGSAADTDLDGTVSVTLQTAGQDQMTYSARGTYRAQVDIQDPAQGVRYIDRWNFQQVYVGGEGGYSYWLYLPFFGPGPLRYTNLRSLSLGTTSPAAIQAKPKVEASTPTVNPAIVTASNSGATVSTTISATTTGLQPGDVAVVEVIDQTVNSPVTFADPPGKVINVPLTRGGTVSANFTINGISSSGSYSFRVYISDIQRNGQSILPKVNLINSNNSATITVNP